MVFFLHKIKVENLRVGRMVYFLHTTRVENLRVSRMVYVCFLKKKKKKSAPR